MRIVVYGLGKSGTTALFNELKGTLPNYKAYFEVNAFLRDNKKALAKILTYQHFHYEYAKQYDKRVVIVRDPRDRLVSATLYSAWNFIPFWQPQENQVKFLELVKQKERSPHSVSMADLREPISGHKFVAPLLDHEDILIKTLDKRWKNLDYFVIKYEDYIDQKTNELEEYLGFPLCKNRLVTDEHKRVTRSKSYGEWKNWFLESDIEMFKPQVEFFMNRFGYSDWGVNKNPVIDPKYASQYIEKLQKERTDESFCVYSDPQSCLFAKG